MVGMRDSVEKQTFLPDIDNLPQSCGHNKEGKIYLKTNTVFVKRAVMYV